MNRTFYFIKKLEIYFWTQMSQSPSDPNEVFLIDYRNWITKIVYHKITSLKKQNKFKVKIRYPGHK